MEGLRNFCYSFAQFFHGLGFLKLDLISETNKKPWQIYSKKTTTSTTTKIHLKKQIEPQPDNFLGKSSEETHTAFSLKINKDALLHFPADNFYMSITAKSLTYYEHRNQHKRQKDFWWNRWFVISSLICKCMILEKTFLICTSNSLNLI